MKARGFFGFDEVDNFAVELIPCWHSLPVQFEMRHGVMCHAASERRITQDLDSEKKTKHHTFQAEGDG